MKLGIAVGIALAILGLNTKAHAYSECATFVDSVFVDVNGHLWVFFRDGLQGVSVAPSAITDRMVALATTAMASGLPVVARYSADGVCSTPGPRGDFIALIVSRPH